MDDILVNNFLGKTVISASFGEGVIAEITKMNEEHFFIVQNQDNNMRHYVPINDSNAYRYITNESDFIDILEKDLIHKREVKEFDSKKDRINFFKEQSKNQKLSNICQNISLLHWIEDKGTLEEQIYQRLIENLSLEYSLIKSIDRKQAETFILDKMSQIGI